MTSGTFRYRWFILSLIIVVLGYTTYNLVDMRLQMKRLDVKSLSGGPVWIATGVEFDALRLENSLLRYSHNQKDGDAVYRAFEILWSRLAQVKRGATYDTLVNNDIDLTVYDSLVDVLVASDSHVTALGAYADNKAVALEISEVLAQLKEGLRTASLKTLQASVSEANDVRIGVLNVASTVLYLSFAFIVLAVLLLVIAAIDSVLTRRRLTEKEALLQEAYAADIAKSQFISVINHELRTPLTSVSASLSLLKSGTLLQTPEKVNRLIEIADHNCSALRKLVDDLLDTERFASGKLNFVKQVIDLSELLIHNIENNKSYADSYGVEISTDGIEPGVKIIADPSRIDQVMANLLSNAVKFSNEGDKVQISLTADAGHAIVAVKDHGRGIPKEDQSRIFERFQQVDSSDKRERGGTGLGLSIVKAIIEAHQAKLTLESELGKGSTFYIIFPISV